jgi:hypothetical protein
LALGAERQSALATIRPTDGAVIRQDLLAVAFGERSVCEWLFASRQFGDQGINRRALPASITAADDSEPVEDTDDPA